ncbi:MAG TPA: HDOD domain-containing protein [Vicinamibacterales bacterium]|jgi:EAL and modified HD-GYP domain-containing signal transduction protein
MQIFVARQPIFDLHDRVFAYEILFRSGLENCFAGTADTADHATSHVISNGAFLGLDTLAQGRLAFVNFSRGPLVGDLALLLPPDRVVIELLETIEPDAEVLAACARLKRAGYRLALDDFTPAAAESPLAKYADFIKVDLLQTPSPGDQRMLARKFGGKRTTMLAEKVETRESRQQTAKAGYQLFQGYFLSHPVIVSAQSVPTFRMNYLRLLQEITRPDVSAAKLEVIVKQDLSITYRLLRHINSAAFGFRTEIHSLRSALALLGLDEIRRWASVWAMADLGRDKPGELVMESVLRGRFCEMIAAGTPFRHRAPELFLLGLFSALDTIMGRPLDEILEALPVPPDVRLALTGEPNLLRHLLDTVLAYEAADWEACARHAAAAGLDDDRLPSCYLEATEWATRIFRPRPIARMPRGLQIRPAPRRARA